MSGRMSSTTRTARTPTGGGHRRPSTAPLVLAGALVAPTFAGGALPSLPPPRGPGASHGARGSGEGALRGSGTGTSTSASANANGSTTVGSTPSVPHDAQKVGAVAPFTTVSLDVALRPADPASLEQFADTDLDPPRPSTPTICPRTSSPHASGRRQRPPQPCGGHWPRMG